jgi:hypothetical protein
LGDSSLHWNNPGKSKNHLNPKRLREENKTEPKGGRPQQQKSNELELLGLERKDLGLERSTPSQICYFLMKKTIIIEQFAFEGLE